MVKNNRNGNRKMKDGKKPAYDKSKTPATSASNRTEVKLDGKKVTKDSERNAEEIQADETMLLDVTKLTDDKEARNKSKQGITVAEQSSDGEEVIMNDKEIKKNIDAIEQTVKFHNCFNKIPEVIFSTEYTDGSNSIFEKYPGLDKFLKFQHREFFANEVRTIRLNEENIERLWNIFYSSSDKTKHDNKAKTNQVSKALKEVRHAKIPKVEKEMLEKIAILRIKHSRSTMAGGNIQKSGNLPENLTVEKQCKKEDTRSIEHIQETEESSHTKEFQDDDETLKKILDDMSEKDLKSKYDSKMNRTTEMASLCPTVSKHSEISKQDIRSNLNKYNNLTVSKSDKDLEACQKIKSPLNIKGMEDLYIEEKQTKDDELEEMKTSKKQTDMINDTIKEFGKSSEFTSQQKTNLREYIKKIIDKESELMLTGKNEDASSSVKEPKTSIGNLKLHEKTTAMANHANIVVDTGESYDERKGKVVKLNKNDNIHFRYETDDNMHISAGNDNYSYTLEEKKDFTFNFKDENIQIYFTGNQIFVSTPNSEFDISFRKSDTVDLTDKATETDNLL